MSSTVQSATPRPTPIAKKDAPRANAAGSAPADTPERKEKDELVLTNQLAESRSPYVRGHAGNPVAWQMWTPETLALAKKHGRVLFVSIGYAACHWCHVMERESFENEDIAKTLNEHFIPIKVDREERPDIDRIYMNFVQATTGSGGWPLNVFLTPDLEPVFGGTYWPGPNAMDGMKDQVGFQEVLQKIVEAWNDQRTKFLESAKEIMPRLKEFTDEGLKGNGGEPEEPLEVELLEEAYQQFMKLYDLNNGGFGLPPKFPVPVKLEFLIRLGAFPSAVQDVVGERECNNAKDMVVKTLKAMAKGGIRDQVGHGFHRYSVTANWSLPHFEKMLYDNAQLLSVYLDAYLASSDAELLATAISTADYLTDSRLAAPSGGFYSSEGADSLYRRSDTEKREGAYYVWTRREFDQILGEQRSSICARYWNVHRDGNVATDDDAHDEFIHQNVLAVSTTPEKLSATFGMPADKITALIDEARAKLLAHREAERPRPNLDDKIVTSWNGLAIGALARAAAVLEATHPEKARKYAAAATRAAEFVRAHLYDAAAGTLRRVAGGSTLGFADDYAFVIAGLLALYEATFSAAWLQWAAALQAAQTRLFGDGATGGFFATAADAPDLILRLKDGLDSQEPSTNGVSAQNLFRLATLLGDGALAREGRRTCTAFGAELMEHPSLFASMLSAVVAANLGVRAVVLAGRRGDPEVEAQLAKVRRAPAGMRTVVLVQPDGDEGSEWLLGRNALYRETLESLERKQGGAVLQVCEGTKCLDVFDMGDLGKVMEELGA